MAAENEQQHFAFISYSSKDMPFAEELESYLKHYRVPRTLRKKKPWLPQKFQGIYRDKKKLLPGQDYRLALREAVDDSKFYIVICSKNSAEPNEEGEHHVNDGVTHFLQNAENRKRLIPIILRDKVKGISTGSLDAYMPPAMRRKKFHAADVGAQGKARAFSDVAAALLELREADELWNDLEREHAAKRRNRCIAAGVLATAAIAAGYAAWDYTTPHTSYYADYVECNNIPVGVNKLTEEQIAARSSHYRFTTHKRRIVRVSHCNSAGKPVIHEHEWEMERPVTMEIEYNAQGQASKRTHADEYGVPKIVWRFHESGKFVNFETSEGRGLATASSFGSTGDMFDKQERKISEIFHFELSRDDRGYVVRELYKNPYTEPAEDENRVGGRAYERDDKGQVSRVLYLDKAGNPSCLPNGVGGYILKRNASGEITNLICIGEDGNSAHLNDQKWAMIELTRDDVTGNITVINYLGTDGKACLCKEGYARVVSRHDTDGNRTETAYYDTDGQLCMNSDGFAKVTCQYDSSGKLEQAYYDANGQTCMHRDGYAKVVLQRNASDNLTETAYFDMNGQPCRHKDGYAKVTYKYDTNGNLEQAYFDTNGQPCRHNDGYFKRTWRHDSDGKRKETAYFDLNGQPCQHKEGYAKWLWRYDPCGKRKESAYFDTDGNPCRGVGGYAKLVWQYDAYGNLEKQAFFDIDGNPCLCTNGYAKVTWQYDAYGNLEELAYFNTDGMPCLHKDGYAKVAYKYNSRGKRTETAYYGEDGKPCLCQGVVKVTQRYDDCGNLTEKAYYGADNKVSLRIDVRDLGRHLRQFRLYGH